MQPTFTIDLQVLILAAGHGTRMGQGTPKVLRHLAGKSLLAHVLDQAYALKPRQINLVINPQCTSTLDFLLDHPSCKIIPQHSPEGTAQAVRLSMPTINQAWRTPNKTNTRQIVLVLYGDVPCVPPSALKQCISALSAPNTSMSLLTMHLDTPFGYGRVIRSHEGSPNVIRIVEEMDASPEQKTIQEVYSGVMAMDATHLDHYLHQVNRANAQKEYYLTQLVQDAANDGHLIEGFHVKPAWQLLGVNTPEQLQQLENTYLKKQTSMTEAP